MTEDMNDVLLAIRNIEDNPGLPAMDGKFIIYGAGNFGKDVFHAAVCKGLSVIAFLDEKAKPGDQYQGIPVFRPADFCMTLDEKENISVVLAVHNRNSELSVIIDTLKNTYGYTCVVTPVSFYNLCGDELGDRYWLTSRSYYGQHEDDIREGFSVWADDASRKLYQDIFKYRITGVYGNPSVPDLKCQYVPADIPPWNKPLRFVDCGAYDGDTVRQFLKMCLPIQALAAFEPDSDNFGKLTRFIGEKNI